MRLRARNGAVLWLGYGMNVHPGGGASALERALTETVAPLRARLGASDPFGICLRLDAKGVEELTQNRARRERLGGLFEHEAWVPFTGNAFVYGDFHGRRLKDEVYRPPWGDPRRTRYTLDFARLLATWSTPGAVVSLSTSPGAWREWPREERSEVAAARQLCACAQGLRALEEETGVWVRLGLEPEPGCTVETIEDLCRFVAGPLAAESSALEADLRYLGACVDVCHLAVSFEDFTAGCAALSAQGISIVKVQASCAIEVPDPADPRARKSLAMVDEPVYLHQVGAPARNGRRWTASDLGAALESRDAPLEGPWRVHFHVPVFGEELAGTLRTTRPILVDALGAVSEGDLCPHVEIETYTWPTLLGAGPRDMDPAGLMEGLEREMRFVLGLLQQAGVHREAP